MPVACCQTTSGTGNLTYDASAKGITSTTTNANATVTVASTAGLYVGQPVSGQGIPRGAVIASIPSATTFTLSANATVTGTNNLTVLTNTTVINANSTLDLNGQSGFANETLTINGVGLNGQAEGNLLGVLVNSSNTPATYAGNIFLGSASSIGSTSLSPGHDFTLAGVVGGSTLLTKVGGNTVTFSRPPSIR